MENLKKQCRTMQQMIDEKKSLKEIRDWSYKAREAGEPVVYMTITRLENENGLWATPTKAQKEFYNILVNTRFSYIKIENNKVVFQIEKEQVNF